MKNNATKTPATKAARKSPAAPRKARKAKGPSKKEASAMMNEALTESSQGVKVQNFFPGYIGQEAVIGEMNETLTLIKLGICEPIRPARYIGPAGLGKTNVAKRIAEVMEQIHGNEHRFLQLPIGCTKAQLIKLLAQHAHLRPCTIFADEAHALPAATRNALKPILETSGQIADVPLSEESVFTANPFQHFWVFASNEDLGKTDPALFGENGRTTPHLFRPYSTEEKKALIRLSLSQGAMPVKVLPEAVDFLETRVWANARSIMEEMGPDLRKKAMFAGGVITLEFAKRYCAGEYHSGVSESMRGTVARYPLGLRWIDIELLRYLNADGKGLLVSECANKIGEPAKTTSWRLQWLCALGMTRTHNSGRKVLDVGGAEYLNTLSKLQQAAKEAKRAQGAQGKATSKASATPALPAPAKVLPELREGATPAPAAKASATPAASGKLSKLAELARQAGLPVPATV